MFFRLALPCLLLAVAISASPLQFGAEIPEDIKKLIPREIVAFYEGLADDEKAAVGELIARIRAKDIKTAGEAYQALRARSESLYIKTKVIIDLVASKIHALDTEAHAFIMKTMRTLRARYSESVNVPKAKETVRNVIKNYLNLSEAAKTDLEEQFPQIFRLLKNKKIVALIAEYFNI